MSDLTPKQRYEERKAERQRSQPQTLAQKHEAKDILLEDMLDRFVTAIERIADAMERRP